MIILLHVVIALSSIATTTYAFFFPSKSKLRLSYSFTAATVATGFYLLAAYPAHMIQTCTTGLIYLAVIIVGTVSARYRLALSRVTREGQR